MSLFMCVNIFHTTAPLSSPYFPPLPHPHPPPPPHPPDSQQCYLQPSLPISRCPFHDFHQFAYYFKPKGCHILFNGYSCLYNFQNERKHSFSWIALLWILIFSHAGVTPLGNGGGFKTKKEVRHIKGKTRKKKTEKRYRSASAFHYHKLFS